MIRCDACKAELSKAGVNPLDWGDGYFDFCCECLEAVNCEVDGVLNHFDDVWQNRRVNAEIRAYRTWLRTQGQTRTKGRGSE